MALKELKRNFWRKRLEGNLSRAAIGYFEFVVNYGTSVIGIVYAAYVCLAKTCRRGLTVLLHWSHRLQGKG